LYLVLVKHPKNERCEFAGIALREELLVDFDEAQFRQQAIWTVLEETLVPETHKRRKLSQQHRAARGVRRIFK
jgi:hypothetical protein